MRTFVVSLAAFMLLAIGQASAASPIYCALYAKEYALHATADSDASLSPTHVQDRAYSTCLNMDDEPVMPTAYVDPNADGIGGPFLEEGSVDPDAETATAAETVDQPAAKQTAAINPTSARAPPKKVTARKNTRGTGPAVGSVEYCERQFPNSFDPKTGTVLRPGTGTRTPCLLIASQEAPPAALAEQSFVEKLKLWSRTNAGRGQPQQSNGPKRD